MAPAYRLKAVGTFPHTSTFRAEAVPREGATAWAVIDVLPAHPITTGPVATAATARSKGAVYEALTQLQDAGVLIPLSESPRNQSWEAAGLLELLESLEAGAE